MSGPTRGGQSGTIHPSDQNGKTADKQSDLEGQQVADDGWVDPYGPAPGIFGWIKLYWHDVLAFLFLGAVGLGFLLWSPVPYRRYFAITQRPLINSDVVAPEFAHPKIRQIVPIIADALVAVFTPIISIVLINILGIGTYYGPGIRTPKAARRGSCLTRRGSFWNVSNGCIGVIYAVMTGAVLQIIIKIAIPGLRPHFLTVCDPQLNNPDVEGEGFRKLYYNASVCRNHDDPDRAKKIANAMQSFPSGHATAAFAGFFYLAIYFNAHLKVFSNYHPSYWKLIIFLIPLLAAFLLCGALYLDMSHNWWDIVAGGLLGTLMAIFSYRMCFASVWDFRWNHVPLVRGSKFGKEAERGCTYSAEEMREWSGGCATRRGGWGVPRGIVCGAPGDSTAFNVSRVARAHFGHGQRHRTGVNSPGAGSANDHVELNSPAQHRTV
jgi:hypothetical protein